MTRYVSNSSYQLSICGLIPSYLMILSSLYAGPQPGMQQPMAMSMQGGPAGSAAFPGGLGPSAGLSEQVRQQQMQMREMQMRERERDASHPPGLPQGGPSGSGLGPGPGGPGGPHSSPGPGGGGSSNGRSQPETPLMPGGVVQGPGPGQGGMGGQQNAHGQTPRPQSRAMEMGFGPGAGTC